MTIKLLYIDPLEDYEIIDKNLLGIYDIEVIFVHQSAGTIQSSKSHVAVHSLCYEQLYGACERTRPDYIACSSEKLFVMLAKIRRELEIKGMSCSQAMLLSHKNFMYEKLNNLFPYPKTIQITDSLEFTSCQALLNSEEIFIKPVNMTGSYETYHVKNDVDYQLFLSRKKAGLENYIAQPYIDAELYHSELVIFNKEILFVSARKYSLPNHLMVSRNEPIFSLNIKDQRTCHKIVEASIQVTKLLNIKNGILHTEFFLDENGNLNFIETNARAPGIGLNRMYRKKFSMSLETILCFIVCDVAPPKIIESDAYFVCGYYPLKAGIVKKIETPKLDVASEWIIYVKPQDVIESARHMSKAAMVMCWDASYEKIKNIEKTLFKHDPIDVY